VSISYLNITETLRKLISYVCNIQTEGVFANNASAEVQRIIIRYPLPANQSAYCHGHSTETTLLKICNDALMVAESDKGMITLVVLLDYSAAFDNMLEVLDQRFGVRHNALKWHQTCLHGPTCSVVARVVKLDLSTYSMIES